MRRDLQSTIYDLRLTILNIRVFGKLYFVNSKSSIFIRRYKH